MDQNFGMIEIDWENEKIAMIIYKTDGKEIFRHEYGFDEKADNNEWCYKTPMEKNLIFKQGYLCFVPLMVVLAKLMHLLNGYFDIKNKLF